jgi:hypothetical protein
MAKPDQAIVNADTVVVYNTTLVDLCATCNDFCNGTPGEIYWPRYWSGYSNLLQSSKECKFCEFVHLCISSYPEYQSYWHMPHLSISAFANNSRLLGVSMGYSNGYHRVAVELEVYVTAGKYAKGLLSATDNTVGAPRPFPFVGARSAISNDSTSDAFMGWLQNKDRMCRDTQNCSPRNAVRLPKRVVDVGISVSNTVSIREMGHVTGSYIALSHCWGADIDLGARTLRSNVTARFTGFEVDRLPKTFRDAILLTRRLGIRYIWIDSLCIIQDDVYVESPT